MMNQIIDVMDRISDKPKKRRRGKDKFFLEVRTDRGWRQVSTFDRADQARTNMGHVSGAMPHLWLRVSKDFGRQFKMLRLMRLRAAIGKYLALGFTIIILVIIGLASMNL